MTTESKPKSKLARMLPTIMMILPMVAITAGVSSWFFLNEPVPRPVLSKNIFHFPATRPVPEFELVDQDGAVFDVESLRGKWSFLFFGYTHCPDICPTTLHSMANIIRTLGEDAQKTQFVFISVDPERDTVERLAEYMPFFHPDMVGLTGTPAQVEQFAKSMWVPYMRVENPESPADYAMDHSASVLLIDPHARYHAIISPPYTVDELIKDWRDMAAFFEGTH